MPAPDPSADCCATVAALLPLRSIATDACVAPPSDSVERDAPAPPNSDDDSLPELQAVRAMERAAVSDVTQTSARFMMCLPFSFMAMVGSARRLGHQAAEQAR